MGVLRVQRLLGAETHYASDWSESGVGSLRGKPSHRMGRAISRRAYPKLRLRGEINGLCSERSERRALIDLSKRWPFPLPKPSDSLSACPRSENWRWMDSGAGLLGALLISTTYSTTSRTSPSCISAEPADEIKRLNRDSLLATTWP